MKSLVMTLLLTLVLIVVSPAEAGHFGDDPELQFLDRAIPLGPCPIASQDIVIKCELYGSPDLIYSYIVFWNINETVVTVVVKFNWVSKTETVIYDITGDEII